MPEPIVMTNQTRRGQGAQWRWTAAVVAALGVSGCKGQLRPDVDLGQPDISQAAEQLADRLPPPVCHAPPPFGAGPHFRDASDDWQLHALAVTGNRLMAADLDEDGFPDLIVHEIGSNNRDDLTATPPRRYRRVLLNRPRPGGGRQFVDSTDASGFTAIRGGGLGRASHFAVAGDVNNDGHLDLFSGTYVDLASTASPKDPGDRNELLLGDGKGKFELGPKSALFSAEGRTTTSAAFLDYDRDGKLDLFVGFFYEIYGYLAANQDRLYRGNGDGTFVEVTDQVGLTTQRDKGFAEGTNSRPTYGVTACDVDGDGDPDLLASAYGRQWNQLWRNDGVRFVDVGRDSGFAGDEILDYNDNEFYRCYCQGKGGCPGVPAPSIACSGVSWQVGFDDQPWRLNGNTFTTLCADYDNDGRLDLFNAEIRHWHIGASSDASQILRNTGGSPLRFERPGNDKLGLSRQHLPGWNEGDISAAFFDFDGDGLQDLLLMDSDYPGTHSWLFHQKSDHTFQEIGAAAGLAHDRGQEVAVADFDGDGDLDVVMGTSTARGGPPVAQVYLYENLVGSRSNWIKVRLIGAGSGRASVSAVGARVLVEAGGARQVREVDGGHGHFGLQNDLTLHFGLGKACQVDRLEVRWPDRAGSKSSFSAVRANLTVEIRQQDDSLRYLPPPT